MKMIDHNHFICHLILGTFTEYPCLSASPRAMVVACGEVFLLLLFSIFFLFPEIESYIYTQAAKGICHRKV